MATSITIAELEKAQDDPLVSFYTRLGRLAEEAGEPEQAREAYQRALFLARFVSPRDANSKRLLDSALERADGLESDSTAQKTKTDPKIRPS